MIICLNMAEFPNNQWIGLRENLQETMVFTIKYGGLINIYIYMGMDQYLLIPFLGE